MWTRWNDIDRMFKAMDLLQTRMNRMFTDFDRYGVMPSLWTTTENGPRTNLYDDGENLVIQMEVPGMGKSDFTIKIQGNYLEVSGTRKSDAPEGYTTHRTERKTVTFTRSFTLPADVNGEKVEAVLTNGLLTLTLPKAETAKPKQISIS